MTNVPLYNNPIGLTRKSGQVVIPFKNNSLHHLFIPA